MSIIRPRVDDTHIPTQTEHELWFMQGVEARMVKNLEESPTHLTFYLIPTIISQKMLGLSISNYSEDPDYQKDLDCFRKTFDKKYCHQIRHHPLGNVWLISCNWDGAFTDPFKNEINILIRENERLTQERNAANARVNSLLRTIGRLAKYGNAVTEEIVDGVAKNSKKFGLQITDDSNKHGGG